MESFRPLHLVPKEELIAEEPPIIPRTETTPDAILREVNNELRAVVSDLIHLDRNEASVVALKRALVFRRMTEGPGVHSDDAELTSLFDRIAEIEKRYGPTAVQEMSRYYTGTTTQAARTPGSKENKEAA